ncbi:MAG: GH116 family glycosyl-hydrolase [Armatimonadota bacterium]|nr:GH116 family glycosyl-hydrolase [Armatimonadota bacterium]MCX7777860.1 GH116 family glycosyl-hydrolase [Armatimonadota bacterium]MDW8025944.1 GH116 family glycosyl-hydrolase [Armatimonadota bacterium]
MMGRSCLLQQHIRRWLLMHLAFAIFLTCITEVSHTMELAQGYSRLVMSHGKLLSYWRMEGNLEDALGKSSGTIKGNVRFVDGPVGGMAIAFDKGGFITFGETPHIDVPEVSVEFFFQALAMPKGYNPCIIAKRITSPNTRFSIHLMQGMNMLGIWNGRSLARATLHEPIQIGRWYHIVVCGSGRYLALFVNGVRCDVIDGGMECGPFNVALSGLPLQIGASQPDGNEQFPCAVDEVAVYGTLLSEQEIVEHIKAAGFDDRRDELLRLIDERRRKFIELQTEVLKRRLSDPKLTERGERRIYSGENLTGISFPVGGIGTGVIHINGYGELYAWQIFNNFTYAHLPHSFFAIRVVSQFGQSKVRAIQTRDIGPFRGMRDVKFSGEYPFGWWMFEDDIGVSVVMEALNPLIPLETRESSIPCAIFNFTVTNTSGKSVDAAILASLQNAVGYGGVGEINGRSFKGYGGNQNRVTHADEATLIHMTSTLKRDEPTYGDMVLMAISKDATATASWENLDALYSDFADDGKLEGPSEAGPTKSGETVNGAISVTVKLKPKEKRTLTFVITWHFPNAIHGDERAGWVSRGNMYANWWENAKAVADEVGKRLGELIKLTRLYHDSLYSSNLPHWLIDRISSQVSVLRSKTCFWGKDGYFGGWEGFNPGSGCCFGNCAHVWHYAQAHAFLFPDIARRMREQALSFQRDDGSIPFRQPRYGTACDGQLGEILGVYREHLMSASDEWLKANWTRVRRAMDFVISHWDKDEDGMLSGEQHNTLDGEVTGTTSWLGSLYLAALLACERMAKLVGDEDAAKRYRRIFDVGAKNQDEKLWNGEYYIQLPEQPQKEDYGNGCHIDQVLGQWWAHLLNLGWVYPKERVKKAMKSLLLYNFRDNFRGIIQHPRKFAEDDDAGMQMITWVMGGRPTPHARYADEVMSGFEYAAATTMVYADMLKEGLMVVKAVYDRYDGRLRPNLAIPSGNPFGDDECGRFYARAMSVWGMLIACQGFIFDFPSGKIGFMPKWSPNEHVSFFTASQGWGIFSQKRTKTGQACKLEIKYGILIVRELQFSAPEKMTVTEVSAQIDGKPIKASFKQYGSNVTITLQRQTKLKANQTLILLLKGKRKT